MATFNVGSAWLALEAEDSSSRLINIPDVFRRDRREAAFLYRAGPFADVRFWHKADIDELRGNVRIWGRADIGKPTAESATGLGVLGLLGWRRKRRASA